MIHTIYENSTSWEIVKDVECDLNATGREIELAKRLYSIMRCCENRGVIHFCDDGDIDAEQLTRRHA